MRAELTSRERVNRMMTRREQDRIPRHDTFWPETIARWRGEGFSGDESTALKLLGSDFAGICWTWPVSFPGTEVIVGEDEQTKLVRDGQGKVVRHWKHRSGTPEHIAFGCDSRCAWEQTYKPALLKRPMQLDLDAVAKRYESGRSDSKWIYLAGAEPFEETRSLMGDEITLMAMADDPEWVIEVATTFTDAVLNNYEAVLARGIKPDGLWTYGDMAYNHATVCSPGMYRELIWPQHKRLCDWAHAHDMKFIYHTDGDVNGVLPLYLDAGFDCIQPIEAKANMDIVKLAPRYGDRLSFFGNIDIMKMATNDLEVIDEEIRSKLTAGMVARGYAYHSDHSVPPSVSWQTYQEIIRLVERYGWY